MARPYYTLESLVPERSVAFLIRRCGMLMVQVAEARFASQPISLVQWQILMWLTRSPHASPSELSRHLGHDLGALTRVVDGLERNALVHRRRSAHDRRAVEIEITPEGRGLAHTGKQFVVQLLNELLEPFSKAEVDVLISLLLRLVTRMQQVAQPATRT